MTGRCLRPDRLFLQDIVDAANGIVAHIAGRDEVTVLSDTTARAAILESEFSEDG